jgi:hypothetical protein
MKILGWFLTGAAGLGALVVAKKVLAKSEPTLITSNLPPQGSNA